MLLERQKFISAQTPMPVDITDNSSSVGTPPTETITFVIASTNVNSSGEAAGTVVYARASFGGIMDSSGERIGHGKDTSFAFVTGTVLTTEVEFPWGEWENDQYFTRALKMAAVGALLTNGQYCINYRTGLIIGKKATTGNSDTANYKYRAGVVTGGGSSFVDNAAFIPGTSTGTVIMAEVDEVATSSATENSAGAVRMTTDRKLIAAGAYPDSTTFTPAGAASYYQLMGAELDDVSTASVTEGQGGALRMTSDRMMYTNLGYLLAGENQTANVMHMRYNGSYTNMTTGTTTTIKSGAGHLHAIIIGLPVGAATISVFDNTAGSGTSIGVITFGATVLADEAKTVIYDCNFATGLTITTSGATNITIIYS